MINRVSSSGSIILRISTVKTYPWCDFSASLLAHWVHCPIKDLAVKARPVWNARESLAGTNENNCLDWGVVLTRWRSDVTKIAKGFRYWDSRVDCNHEVALWTVLTLWVAHTIPSLTLGPVWRLRHRMKTCYACVFSIRFSIVQVLDIPRERTEASPLLYMSSTSEKKMSTESWAVKILKLKLIVFAPFVLF